MSNILNSEKNFKSLVAFGVSAAIDKFIYKSPNLKNTLILASVAGISNYVSSTVQENNLFPTILETYNSENINIKTIEQRLLEISLASVGAYTINNQILKNMRANLTIQDCVMLFAVPSVVAEYISDYMFSKKLSYLS